MGLFNDLEEKYDALIEKLELDGVRRPKTSIPSMFLILVGFIIVLITLLLPVSYDFRVNVSLDSSPRPNSLLVLTSDGSEIANLKIDSDGLLTFNDLTAIVSKENASVVFNGRILRLPFKVFAKYGQFNKTINLNSVFEQRILSIDLSSSNTNYSKSRDNESLLYCNNGVAAGNCVNNEGDYCDAQTLTVTKKNSCYTCSDGTIRGECSVSKTGYVCNDQQTLVEDLTKCSEAICPNDGENLKAGECSKKDIGYSCDGLSGNLIKTANCADITVCQPQDSACLCKKDPRLCTSKNTSTSSMLVSVYDNSSSLLSGLNVSVRLYKNYPISYNLDEMPETLQYTTQGIIVFNNLVIGESYKAVATAIDCGISGSSNLEQITPEQIKATISLRIIKTSNGCKASYETTNTTIQIGNGTSSSFTIFPSPRVAFYDLYPENYLNDYPDEVLSGVQRGSPVFENRMQAGLNYYGIAWTPGFIYSDLQKVNVLTSTNFSLEEQKNARKNWDSRRLNNPNSGNLTVTVLDEADIPISDAIINIYDESFTTLQDPISVNKYLSYVLPASIPGSLKTGYNGQLQVAPLKKDREFKVTAISGAASGSGTIKITNETNNLTIRLSLHFANVSLSVYDPYDNSPVSSTIKLTHYGSLTIWSCNISPSNPNCAINNVYAGVPIYVNVTSKDPDYTAGTDAIEYFIIGNATYNKRDYQLTKPRDEPYMTNPVFYDFYTGAGPLTSITLASKLKVVAKLQLPKNTSDWTGYMIKLQDDSIISTPIDANAFGFTAVNENSLGNSYCQATDIGYFANKRSPNTASPLSYSQFQLLYWNSSNYPNKQIPIVFNIQTSLQDDVEAYSLYYSAFSQAGKFTLRSPKDDDLQRNFSFSNLNFCQANKTQSTILFVKNAQNTVCASSYCFTVTDVNLVGSGSLNKNDFISNVPAKVQINGYLQFQDLVTQAEFNSITVSGGDSIIPGYAKTGFTIPESIAPNDAKQKSYSFTPNIPVNTILTREQPYSIVVSYDVTGVTGKSVLSIEFPKIKGSQAIYTFPLNVGEPSTGTGEQPDQYLASRDPGECNGTITITKKGDSIIPSCSTIVLRLSSVFPADGILFNYSGFTPSALRIEERDTKTDVSGSLYGGCFSSADELINPTQPMFRFSSFGVSGDCPYSRFGPVGNNFNTIDSNGTIFKGKIRFLSEITNATLNFTVKVAEWENIFNATTGFSPNYYAFKTKIWNTTIDSGATEAGFENVSLVGIYYNNQLRTSFSNTDQPLFKINNVQQNLNLQQLGKSNPNYFFINEGSPGQTFFGSQAIGFSINTEATRTGAGSFAGNETSPVIPLENILFNSIPNNDSNALAKANKICKISQAFDTLVNTSAFYRYSQDAVLYCAKNYNGLNECRPSIEAWKNVSLQTYSDLHKCTGIKDATDTVNTDAYYTICNQYFTSTGQSCDYNSHPNDCINPASNVKTYSYDASCFPGDFMSKTGTRSITGGQLIKILDPDSPTLSYAYGANVNGTCNITLAINGVNQIESPASYTKNDALVSFTTKNGENALHLLDSSTQNTLTVYCSQNEVKCGNPSPFQTVTKNPIPSLKDDIIKYACNWDCSPSTGYVSISRQKKVENWENITNIVATTLLQNPDARNKFKKMPYELFLDKIPDNNYYFEFNFPVNLMYDYQKVIDNLGNLISQGQCGKFTREFTFTKNIPTNLESSTSASNGIYNFKVKVLLTGSDPQSISRNPLQVSYAPIKVDTASSNYGLGFLCSSPSSQPYLYGKVYAYGTPGTTNSGCIVGNNLPDVDYYSSPLKWKFSLNTGTRRRILWHCSNDQSTTTWDNRDDGTSCAKPLLFDYFTVAQKTGAIVFPDKDSLISAREWDQHDDYRLKIITFDKNLQKGIISSEADNHNGAHTFCGGTVLGGELKTIIDGFKLQVLTDEHLSHGICGYTGRYNGVDMCSDC